MDERGLARARHDRAPMLEHPMVGEDDVKDTLGATRWEAGQVLDRPTDDVVAERYLALEATGVAELDRAAGGGVCLDLADVVKQRAGDRQVAVEPRKRGRHRADPLRHRQRMLQQPVPVGLVVVLGRRSVAPDLPDLGFLAEERVEQRPQVTILDRGDQLAEVGNHLVVRDRRSVEQIGGVVLARVGRADRANGEARAVARIEAEASGGDHHGAGSGRGRGLLDALPHDALDRACDVPELQLEERLAVALLLAGDVADHERGLDPRAVRQVAHEHLRAARRRGGGDVQGRQRPVQCRLGRDRVHRRTKVNRRPDAPHGTAALGSRAWRATCSLPAGPEPSGRPWCASWPPRASE